ncbi:MAG: Lrp/AsnC family transcriptional regulator [Rhodospirillaceae bacterium]|jgi:Lrp/AsnC family transcriptional regulator, leucine-responsive regulatory protein|nr:Lrp/AsnC family transcriptional regulator [Rhodospirillaceae bacterium]MBT4590386.1 Lrp/AsnC family transcriptional regulator [Rhodospirillaceae bacterium]MBT4939195.1 Lrp/AsnC family transcriptional regulator [Rhodospirillaceae bacterium]MBT5938655.1 Lrp/AsnC family transcriptional regulator [Rhodospirillaceae bacterium]MBT7267118.1 Lrp/AsnC family transcriptional regulator [Rhodospirillaceae bacterium]
MELDAADIKILNHLQGNARASNAEIAETAHLSASQCHRRVKRLEEANIIKGYSAEIDAARVGLDINAFVHVTLGTHEENRVKAFVDAIEPIEEIQECYSVTGDADYILRVSMPNLAEFSNFMMHRLMPLPMVGNVKSYIVMENVRKSSRLPLAHL